jgi:hypothetical protein
MPEDAPLERDPMTQTPMPGSSPERGSSVDDAERARLLDRLASFGLADGQPPLFASTDLATRRRDTR